MLETQSTLFEEIRRLLGALRCLGEGRYACLVDTTGLLLEDVDEPGEEAQALRQFIETRIPRLFELPRTLEGEGPQDDLFEGWSNDEFLLAFINGKVGVVVACPDAAALERQSERPLRALADRLFRVNAAWRVDERGRGFWLGRARLDTVVIGALGGDEKDAPAQTEPER